MPRRCFPTRGNTQVTGKEPGASNNVFMGGLNVVVNPQVKEAVMAPVNILTGFFNSIAKAWMEMLGL